MNNCRKTVILTGLIFSLTNLCAQTSNFKFGIKGGLNLATALVNDAASINFNPGFHIGGIVEYPLSSNFALQSELLLSKKGAKIKGFNSGSYTGGTPDYTYTFNAYYLELPVYAVFKKKISGSLKLGFGFGPYFGYGIGGNTKRTLHNGVFSDGTTEISWKTFGNGVYDENRDWLTGETLNRFDFGLGLKADLEYNKFIFGIGFESGIIDIMNKKEYDEDLHYRNINMRISLGYRL